MNAIEESLTQLGWGWGQCSVDNEHIINMRISLKTAEQSSEIQEQSAEDVDQTAVTEPPTEPPTEPTTDDGGEPQAQEGTLGWGNIVSYMYI